MLVNGLTVRLFGLTVVMFSKVLNYGWLQLQCDIQCLASNMCHSLTPKSKHLVSFYLFSNCYDDVCRSELCSIFW